MVAALDEASFGSPWRPWDLGGSSRRACVSIIASSCVQARWIVVPLLEPPNKGLCSPNTQRAYMMTAAFDH